MSSELGVKRVNTYVKYKKCGQLEAGGQTILVKKWDLGKSWFWLEPFLAELQSEGKGYNLRLLIAQQDDTTTKSLALIYDHDS